jgi:peptidoglycan-N-acetylglucosamine deacetylase
VPVLKRLYPRAIWNQPRKEKTIYLTFDDGPVEGLTDWILDELKRHDARATFFCVGQNILKNKTLYQRIKSEGHLTANHTMTHVNGFTRNVREYMGEVEACSKLVENKVFRPPYGKMKRSQYKALVSKGFKVILWDVISYDYEKISEKACARNSIHNAKRGSIVLFHDNMKAEKNVKYALPLFLRHFKTLGYSFQHLPY